MSKKLDTKTLDRSAPPQHPSGAGGTIVKSTSTRPSVPHTRRLPCFPDHHRSIQSIQSKLPPTRSSGLALPTTSHQPPATSKGAPTSLEARPQRFLCVPSDARAARPSHMVAARRPPNRPSRPSVPMHSTTHPRRRHRVAAAAAATAKAAAAPCLLCPKQHTKRTHTRDTFLGEF